MFIEICGGIASGKTTLAIRLKELGFAVCFEDFQKNPFWEDFYHSPHEFAFETELTFTLQHYSLIKKARPQIWTCHDFSLVQDIAYADINLVQNKHKLFLAVAAELRKDIGYPNILVCLNCDEKNQMERIRARNRKPEQGISFDYLASLNDAIQNRVHQLEDNLHVITIDSSRFNFQTELPYKIKQLFLSSCTGTLPGS